METQSVSKTERLAKASRNSGIISLGLLMISFLFLLLLSISGAGDAGVMGVLIWLGALSFVVFIASLVGCLRAIVALVKIRKEGGDNRLQRVATTGLVLNSLGILLSPPLLYFLLGDIPLFHLS